MGIYYNKMHLQGVIYEILINLKNVRNLAKLLLIVLCSYNVNQHKLTGPVIAHS